MFRHHNRFRIALFEAVFVAALSGCAETQRRPQGRADPAAVKRLSADKGFKEASRRDAAATVNVKRRLEIAGTIIGAL